MGQNQKQRLSRQDQQRLQALEEDLFAGSRHPTRDVFGAKGQEAAERLPTSYNQEDEQKDAQPLLIWEDRGRANANVGDDSSESDAEDESDISAKGRDVKDAEDDASEDDHTDSQANLPAAEQESEIVEAPPEVAVGSRKPAWEDPDEADLHINIAATSRLRKLRASEAETTISGKDYSAKLKQQHAKLNLRTSWASLKRKRKLASVSDDEADIDDRIATLDQGATSLLAHRALLPAGLLQTTRLKDANQKDPSNAAIQSIEFHPNGVVLLTAGLDKKLKFFQVDGVKNSKIQSIHLDDLPIHKAAFACGGSKVILSGRRKHFYLFDIQAGKMERISQLTNRTEKSLERFAVSPSENDPLVAFLGTKGSIPLVSLDSRQVVAQLKISGSVKAATFSPDSTLLFASGSDGVIHTWDMRNRKCISRFVDEGALHGTSLACSPGQQYLAAGSDAGFVNIYNQQGTIQGGLDVLSQPVGPAIVRPAKSLTSLLTTVDSLSFSPDGQILAMASKAKKDALRLVHTRSMTVFSNWPTTRSPIHFPTSMAFSPNGGYFAVGNAKGKALLYRLHHYEQA